jgi:hypothetical protein
MVGTTISVEACVSGCARGKGIKGRDVRLIKGKKNNLIESSKAYNSRLVRSFGGAPLSSSAATTAPAPQTKSMQYFPFRLTSPPFLPKIQHIPRLLFPLLLLRREMAASVLISDS